ncbi:hypothetical protein H4219_001671 [Mycoemilia scoparia]|uniref:Uncharacterized protein n=1 Tax=Mycoemilia scoparia TaxID=417184 RepID=A0A9W8A2Y1_9FUNG|nr:hypothetical protein H4219_001671 [Mycoemilia scoparia]
MIAWDKVDSKRVRTSDDELEATGQKKARLAVASSGEANVHKLPSIKLDQNRPYNSISGISEEIEDLVVGVFHEDDRIKDSFGESFNPKYFRRLKYSFGETFVLDYKYIHLMRSLFNRWHQNFPNKPPPISTDDACRLVKLISDVTVSVEAINLKSLISAESIKSNKTDKISEQQYLDGLASRVDNVLSNICLGAEAALFVLYIVSCDLFDKKVSFISFFLSLTY